MNCPSSEKWKDIPGYEGIYEASTLGRIRSAQGKTTSSARYPVRVWKQRVLKPKLFTRKSGMKEQRVSLWKDGVERSWLVARLIALTFIPVPMDKLTVNHINGNPMDNQIENLEWSTLKENIQHGFNTGLYKSNEKPVVLISTKDGSETQFKSMAEASRYLERNNGYVSMAISKSCTCYSKDGEKYYVRLEQEGDASS